MTPISDPSKTNSQLLIEALHHLQQPGPAQQRLEVFSSHLQKLSAPSSEDERGLLDGLLAQARKAADSSENSADSLQEARLLLENRLVYVLLLHNFEPAIRNCSTALQEDWQNTGQRLARAALQGCTYPDGTTLQNGLHVRNWGHAALMPQQQEQIRACLRGFIRLHNALLQPQLAALRQEQEQAALSLRKLPLSSRLLLVLRLSFCRPWVALLALALGTIHWVIAPVVWLLQILVVLLSQPLLRTPQLADRLLQMQKLRQEILELQQQMQDENPEEIQTAAPPEPAS